MRTFPSARPARTLFQAGLLLAGVALLGAPLEAQEAERKSVLERSGPSVVGIRNDESYGSGFILDDQGTILTNAHVIASPLPLRVEAQWTANGQVRRGWFRKVVLIGVHPSRDLAILRIDPSENNAKLTPLPLAKSKATRHDLIFAIGYPNTFGGMQKICTSGEVTGVDRFVDMPGYFEFSAEVHPGNSGGPVVDTFGNAVGVVTRGEIDGERVAWAIPLFDLRPDQFVPLDRRAKDPARASRLLRVAEEQLKKARKGGLWNGLFSGELFQLALLDDISNPDIYYKIGMIERVFDECPTASAYLMRAIQLEPWGGDNRANLYHEMGVALYLQNRPADATVVWNEGIAKYPDDCGKIWDDLATRYFQEARFLDAACASQSSLRIFGPRAGNMNGIYDQSRRRLDPSDIAKLTAYEDTIASRIQKGLELARRARQDGKRFVTPECESLVRSFAGVQREANNFNFGSLGQGPNAPKAVEIPDAEITPVFIRARIAVAAEHLEQGRIQLAIDTLEDIIKTYPKHPETQAARDLLAFIRKSQ